MMSNAYNKLARIVMSICFVAALSAGAETRIWKADVGSGAWSNPDNWENGVPVAGDTVRITNEVSNAVITNDLGAMRLEYFVFYGTQPVTFGSPKLTLSGGLTTRNASIINCDLHISQNVSLKCGDRPNGNFVNDYPQATCEPTFNGNITVADGKYLYITGDSGAQFNGTLTGRKAYLRNGTVNWSSGKFHFNRPVDFKEIQHYGADQSQFYFNAAGNHYERFSANYTTYYFTVPNAMAPEGVISFDDTGDKSEYKGYFLYSDQTINRFDGSTDPGAKDRHWFAVSDESHHIEVVARGTGNGSSYVRLMRNMGFTWAPVGDYTQEFSNRTHTAYGPLVVSNGTIKITGACSFKSVKQITVRKNATFHHASTAAEALRDVTLVTLEDGATFKVDDGASDPFTKSPMFVVGSGAKVDVAAGATVSIGNVQLADGTFPATGAYTSSNSGWVTGAGTVNVTASTISWLRAADGDFNDAANWANGVLPSNNAPAYVTANGANYTVSLDTAPAANAGGLRLANDATHTNVLAVSAAATFSGEKIDVGTGGRIEVNDGGTFKYLASTSYGPSTKSFLVHDGGRVEVNGGNLQNNSLYGQLALSGTGDAEGVLAIHSGTCLVHNQYAGNGLWIYSGGRLVMDGGLLDLRLYTNNYRPLTLDGGEMDVGGDAVIQIGNGRGLYFGNGTANFSGNARITRDPNNTTARFIVSPRTATDVTRINFTGSSRLDIGGAIGTSVGCNAPVGSKAIMRFASSAASVAGAFCAVGDCTGYGELEIESGSLYCGASGFRVGSCISNFGSPVADGSRPEGVVKVSGGVLQVSGSQAGSGANYDGIIVGDGIIVSNGTASTSFHKGTLEISGGLVTNELGYVSVGIGKAKGVVRQTGGRFVSGAAGRAVTIGSFGGEGEWTMDGGTTTVVSANLFVGGCTFADWNKSTTNPMFGVESGSTGTLAISNGTFSVGWYAYVGKNGTGLVEIGTGGVFNVTGHINMCEGGTLKFVFGPEGTGKVQSNANLIVDENAKLVLDVSAYGSKPGRFKLITVGGSLGQFASENVEIVGGRNSLRVALEYRNKTLTCSLGSGFLMVVR